jgi:hypothetical protein
VTDQRPSRPATGAARLPRSDVANLVSLGLLAVTLALVMTTAMNSPLKDDVAWLLYVARKWMGGKRLYVDLVEVNPPLIVWFYAFPAWLADRLQVLPRLVATPFFCTIVLACAGWCALLLRGRGALLARPVPIFAAVGIVLLAIPGVEFGQREHLLIALSLPYLCLFAREMAGEPEPIVQGILAGIAAGLGCALKPTYVLAFALVELIGLLRGRRILRAAPLSACVTGLAYAVAVMVICPEFLAKAVPLALALYGGTDTSLPELLIESKVLFFGVGTVAVLALTAGRVPAFAARPGQATPVVRALLTTLSVFAVGATIAYLMQGKNWFYHRLPATVPTLLALVLWVSALLTSRPLPLRRVRLLAPLALASLLVFVVADYERLSPWVMRAAEPNLSTEVKLERLLKHEHARTYIAFSEWIALGFPVVNDTGVTWASRFDSMWALHGELWRAKQDGRDPAAWPIRRWVAGDFVAGCPDIVVVDTREGINYVAVLIAAGRSFAQAWSHYREIAAFDGLRVLKRSGPDCLPHRPRQEHLAAAAIEPP